MVSDWRGREVKGEGRTSCLSSMAQLILLLFPVPRSIIMCLFR
jgi:hypothetical protein